MQGLVRKSASLLAREDGAMTAFGLIMFVVSCALGGIALDVSNSIRLRTHLQIAADSAAHAALVARQTQGEAEAIDAALRMVHDALPSDLHGSVLLPEDIVFGIWDQATRAFTPSLGATDAVMVDTARMAARGNGVRTFLLSFVGVDSFDVVRRSIANTYFPTCMLEGFVGDEYVAVTSGNTYTSGFCIHSNGYASLNNNNVYERGAIVSMPDRRDVVLPNGGWASNIGIEDALRDGYYEIDAAGRVGAMLQTLASPGSPAYPEFLTSTDVVTLNWQDPIDATVWQTGRIHQVSCANGNQRVRVTNDTVLREGVLITNCEIAFGSGTAVEDVTVVTTSTSVDSITGAAGIRMGVDDNCAPGGGAQFFTLGGLRVPSGFKMYGSRVVAGGAVSFTADVGGIDGVSVISDQHVEATAGGEVGFCGIEGLPDWAAPRFYRIVY
ncbi:pilus assembly protein TadG-related protein [Roseibacterium sp. SDUM158017]|uniref:pilus assembly protein TadG-related protein n=1 Tax=Roseicyclus salinarum TaxID=3036773 RepID=UPI00241532A3|nr:pilus assembly protein TadG-related protein [Roseibacterium sp. SDUM158017]MDG4647856.1 pilus assembly protein TadG-related protein [Roseibacterium sp. SDUM158017]